MSQADAVGTPDEQTFQTMAAAGPEGSGWPAPNTSRAN